MSHPPDNGSPSDAPPGPLSEHDGQELRRIATTTLREYAYVGSLPPGAPHRKTLLELRGAAVHLYRHDQLRGRALLLEAEHPLYYTVELAAVQAGFLDPTAERIAADEIHELTIVVTVVGAPRTISESELASIDPATHAVAVRRGPCRAAYTPECMRAYQWDRDAYFAALRRSVDEGAGGALMWTVQSSQTFGPRPIL